MRYYSTKNPREFVSAREAVLRALAPDGALYMPEYIPTFCHSLISDFSSYSLCEMAYTVASEFFPRRTIPQSRLEAILADALDFDLPLRDLCRDLILLELFHGPTLAFKDFGARFMARLMSYFQEGEKRELVVLVATSGDTGGAVASGFFGVEGIRVCVLYPSKGVSRLQEKQLSTLGQNIVALEIDGSFDDCQSLVKEAFLDGDLRSQLSLTSANSINVARLIPQSFYYFFAHSRLKDRLRPLAFSVPSGNFGNLTAGLLAREMGLPVERFIAVTNANRVVVDYLKTGCFEPRPSIRTISNAMDVGDPSNFERVRAIYRDDFSKMRLDLYPCSFSDDETRRAISELYCDYAYVSDPHTAVACLGARAFLRETVNCQVVALATAHPAKFLDVVSPLVDREIELPESLAERAKKRKRSVKLSKSFEDLKNYLLS